MISDKEINFFQKNGYLVKKSNHIESVSYLQNKVFNLIVKKNKIDSSYKKKNKNRFF